MVVNNGIELGDWVQYDGPEIYIPIMVVKAVDTGWTVCVWYDEKDRIFKEHKFPVEILKKVEKK